MSIKRDGNKAPCKIVCVSLSVILLITLICIGGAGNWFLSRLGIDEEWLAQFGTDDWGYELPNGYEISRVNSNCVVLGKNGDVFEQMVDRYVVSFCYNQSFVGLQRIPLDDIAANESIDIQSYDRSSAEYYLVDTENDTIYGPYTEEEEYTEKCVELSVGDMCEWIETTTKPEGATP